MQKKFKLVIVITAILFVVMALFVFVRIKLLRHKVFVKKTKEGRYHLVVEGKPYFIKGVCYNPAPIGEGYDYDLGQDKCQPWLIDGKMMSEAGVNTIRLYKSSDNHNGLKKAIGDFYEKYGIRTALGHWLGFWEYPQPFYADPEFRERIKKEVLGMVKTYKDEKGILFWILGNENNYSFSGRVNPWVCPEADKAEVSEQANIRAKIYYSFVNEIACEIHKIDPNHPVVLGNGELGYLDVANKFCPDIDIVGILIYRGKTFGNIFNGLKSIFDKPLLLVEFGADSYNSFKKQEDQEMQSFFLEAQWKEIYKNSGFAKDGAGNCLGGFIFEWSDEWWKHNSDNSLNWEIHDTEAGWSQGAYYFDNKAEKNLNMNEEWFGIVGVSEEKESEVNKRLPRKAYYMLKKMWENSSSK
ncbi:MAG: hypothetical protein AABY43_03375 [Candidatus Omnitrophota bacterium]